MCVCVYTHTHIYVLDINSLPEHIKATKPESLEDYIQKPSTPVATTTMPSNESSQTIPRQNLYLSALDGKLYIDPTLQNMVNVDYNLLGTPSGNSIIGNGVIYDINVVAPSVPEAPKEEENKPQIHLTGETGYIYYNKINNKYYYEN